MCAKGQTECQVRTIVHRMESNEPARWKELCEQISDERDPVKLLALGQEVIRLLQENEDRSSGSGSAA